jgi:hypothetical protein
VDIEPLPESYNVREITISDEHGKHHATWQTDEYRLQLAAPQLLKALESQVEATRQIVDAWGELNGLSQAVEDLIETLERQRESARAELNAWGTSDFVDAVGDLEDSLRNTLKTIADAKGGAA